MIAWEREAPQTAAQKWPRMSGSATSSARTYPLGEEARRTGEGDFTHDTA